MKRALDIAFWILGNITSEIAYEYGALHHCRKNINNILDDIQHQRQSDNNDIESIHYLRDSTIDYPIT